MNPELEICHLADGARFEMTLTIGRGRGYVAAEGNKGPETTIGVIPVDSIFSPVRRVSVRRGHRSRRPAHRLRQAHARGRPPTARSPARRRPARGRAAHQAARRSSPTSTHRAGPAPGRRGGRGGGAAGARDGEHPDRGARARRPLYNCLKRVGIETIGDLVSKSERSSLRSPTSARSRSRRSRRRWRRRGWACGGTSECAPESGTQARPRLGPPQGAVPEPGRAAVRARPHPHDLGEGQGGAAVAEKLITLGKDPATSRPAPGGRVPAQKDASTASSHEVGAALRGAPGRLHAHRQARPAPGRRRAMAYIELVD